MKNIILCIVFLALTIFFPINGLLQNRDHGQEAIDRGEVVFNENNRNRGAKTAQYGMLFLFGSLTLVYGFRIFQKSDKVEKA
jgi:hypothetical protein